MRTMPRIYEEFKVRIDQIADARGITFDEKVKFVKKALSHLKKGQILTIYCSDIEHKKLLPDWLKKEGLIYLGTINHSNYYKIIVIKD